MNKNKLYIAFSILITFIILISSYIYIDNNFSNKIIKETKIENKIDKNSELNNIKISLISNYFLPYKDVYLQGNNLIDGSYANRTVFVFLIENISNLNENFKNIELYKGEEIISCNLEAYRYHQEDIIAIMSCDNRFNINDLTIKISVNNAKTNKIEIIDKKLDELKYSKEKVINIGSLLNIGDKGYWLRLDNTDNNTNKLSKYNSKGLYFEYSRTLEFINFGEQSILDENNLKIESPLNYNYDVSFNITEQNLDGSSIYKSINNLSHKFITVNFKIYIDDINNNINNNIIENIEKSYIAYNDQKIYLSKEYIKEE